MKLAALNRWKAAAIHLGLTALIAATVVIVMLMLWYPRPYFEAMGGRELLTIIVGVDVTIGPLLTLIVFDLKKKSLKFDLTVIVVLQVAALAYGAWVTFEARPAYVVFVKDRFQVVAANAFDPADLAAGPAQYRDLSLTGPRIIGARLPTNPEERSDLAFQAMAGKDVPQLPKYYVPYADVAAEALLAAKPVTVLVRKYPEALETVRAFAAAAGRPESGLAYVPLVARKRSMVAVLDTRDGRLAGVLAFDPF
jgi:hypothetical protein